MRKIIGTLLATAALTTAFGALAATDASAASPRTYTRTICAQDVTVRINDSDSTNQPVGYLRHGDTFYLDHYSPSGAWAVGEGVQSDGHHVVGYVVHNTITDASGHCQPPYN